MILCIVLGYFLSWSKKDSCVGLGNFGFLGWLKLLCIGLKSFVIWFIVSLMWFRFILIFELYVVVVLGV